MEFVDTFEYHRSTPEICFDTYVRSRRIELGESLQSKTKIYLDTKYWIYFRDVLLGRKTEGPLYDAYHILDSLCESGEVVCPISEDIFYEILKQDDHQTLASSIELMERFSKGICIASQSERIQAEILYFYYRYTKQEGELYSPDVLVWTKINDPIMCGFPSGIGFNEKESLIIKKAFFDQMWFSSLSEVCNVIGLDSLMQLPKMPDFSHLLNTDNLERRESFSSFKQVFLDEIYIAVQEMSEPLKDGMEYMYRKETGRALTDEERAEQRDDKTLTNVVCNLFRLGKAGDNFPTLKVGAGVHAAVRIDKKRTFEANDYYDFRHAQAAVPYCDYLFTEKNLRHLLRTNSLSYDVEYECNVISKPKEVLDALSKIRS